jgi:hypothetical protein
MQYLPQKYNLDNIIYDTPEKVNDEKIIINIYDSKKKNPLYIQTPELVNIFGPIKKNNYHELLLPLGGVSCLLFKQFLFNLQNKILTDANHNRHIWFNNQKSVKFIPIVKEINKDATSSMEQTEHLEKCDDGIIKIKITNTTIIKKDDIEININELVKNNKIRMIIQVYAIWVNKTNETNKLTFGIYIKPEIIEERNSFNLSFIEEEKVLFESDDEDNNSTTSSDNSTSSNSDTEDK